MIKDMKEKKDIFDRIMSCAVFSIFNPFYKKNKEILLYLFFGGLTFIVSILSYIFFEFVVGMSPLIANLFSWILAVSFAYVTNRIWVFSKVAYGFTGVAKELFAFFIGRIITLVLEEVILFIGISILDIDSVFVKIIGQIIVILSNYFISKRIVFNTTK